MNKIKIAFFADVLIKNYDGAIRTMYHIIDRMPQDRFELKAFCGDPPNHDFPHAVFKVKTITLPFNKNYKMAIPIFDKAKLVQALDAYAPDVIHISTPSPLGFFALQYAKRKGIKVSTIYHTHFVSYVDYYLESIKGLVNPAKQLLNKKLGQFYNQCDRVFIPTKEMRTHLKAIGIKEDQLVLWPRGIDKTIFNPLQRDKDWLANQIGNKKPNILFASRLVWEKNLKTLVEVYRHYESLDAPYNFIICGDGVAFNALKEMMPNAFFIGKVQQKTLAKYFASSDVFLFPSISETYGNVVTEAMACGLPCVIANGGGSKSFIRHGHNGFLAEPYDINTYCTHIDQLTQSPNLHQKFKVNGLKHVKGMDWEDLVLSFYTQLQDLCSESVKGRVAA